MSATELRATNLAALTDTELLRHVADATDALVRELTVRLDIALCAPDADDTLEIAHQEIGELRDRVCTLETRLSDTQAELEYMRKATP